MASTSSQSIAAEGPSTSGTSGATSFLQQIPAGALSIVYRDGAPYLVFHESQISQLDQAQALLAASNLRVASAQTAPAAQTIPPATVPSTSHDSSMSFHNLQPVVADDSLLQPMAAMMREPQFAAISTIDGTSTTFTTMTNMADDEAYSYESDSEMSDEDMQSGDEGDFLEDSMLDGEESSVDKQSKADEDVPFDLNVLQEILGAEMTEKYLKGHLTFAQLTDAFNAATTANTAVAAPSSIDQTIAGVLNSSFEDSSSCGSSFASSRQGESAPIDFSFLDHDAPSPKPSPAKKPRHATLRERAIEGAAVSASSSSPVSLPKSANRQGRKDSPFRPSRTQIPQLITSLLGQANVAFASGRREEAIQMCYEAIRQRPDLPDVYFVLANFYEEMNEPAKQLQCSLLAAHLRPSLPAESWSHLAELSIAQGQLDQAIKLIDKAIRSEPTTCEFYERKAEIHRLRNQPNEVRKTYQAAAKATFACLPADDYVPFAKKVAKESFEAEDIHGAITCMTLAVEKASADGLVVYEELHYLVEMLMSQQKFQECLNLIFKFGGMSAFYEAENVSLNDLLANEPITSFQYPEDFPVDLKVKLIVCFIHLGLLEAGRTLLGEFEELHDFHEDGDLFFDVADALATHGCYEDAHRLLSGLVATEQFGVAAVWLRYAQVLEALGSLDAAADAFGRVVELVPAHIDARVSLASVQRKLGKAVEALKTLEPPSSAPQEDVDQKLEQIPPMADERLLFQKCLVFHDQADWDSFIMASKQLLAVYFSEFYSEPDFSRNPRFKGKVLGTPLDVRNVIRQTLRPVAYSRFVKRAGRPSANMTNLTTDDVWRLFRMLCEQLLSLQRYQELLTIACFGVICPTFYQNGFRSQCERILLLAAIYARETRVLWTLIRQLDSERNADAKVWNLYNLVFALGSDDQMRNFIKTLFRDAVNRQPDCAPLEILLGNMSIISGSYQYALLEYLNVYPQMPDDPLLSLLIGVTYCALSCKKDIACRHEICLQGLAFMSRYEKSRGRCQEVYYNFGRMMQQIGLVSAAVHFYKQVFELPSDVPEKPALFDLKREAAHNLAIIYENSGNRDLALTIYEKYLTI